MWTNFLHLSGEVRLTQVACRHSSFFMVLLPKQDASFTSGIIEPAVDLVMRTSIPRILAKGQSLPPLDQDLKQQLSLSFQDEFDELEQILQIDLSSWRQHEEVHTPVKV